jgi:hypothetical protein
MKAIITLCYLFSAIILSTDLAKAQYFVRHQQPPVIERDQSIILEFEIDQVSHDQVLESLLFVRDSNSGSFSQMEERFDGGRSRFELNITDENITGIEYYFVLRLTDGNEIVYPNVNQGENPVYVDIVDSRDESLPVADFVNYTILSPRPGSGTVSEDLLVAIAFFHDGSIDDHERFGITVNGIDVSEQAEITPFTIKYQPGEGLSGQQEVLITYETDNQIYQVATWTFTVLTDEPVSAEELAREERSWMPTGNIELSGRNQQISGFNNDALTGRIRLSGEESGIQYNIGAFLTSQESGRLQPQNRYNIELRYGESVHLQAGDFFPRMSDLTISGRRVRGVGLGLRFWDDRIETQILRGQLNRSVSNLYEGIQAEEITIGDMVVDTLVTLGYREGGMGTFKQNITGARIAVGNRDRFQVAFQGAKIQDDTTSIGVINDYNDLILHDQSLASGLNNSERNFLLQNPDRLQVTGGAPRPRGNVAFSGELNMSFDDHRIRFASETGISLLNNDISGGPLNQQRASELGVELDADVERLIDRLSWLIIINDQMNTLPFKYTENASGDLEVDPFFPTSVIASDSRMQMNYFGHQMQVRYQWIGPDYYSLANSTIRRDIAGFGITDRFRLLDNRLNVTLGYENLRDNLMDTRDATLKTITYRAAFSWYPVNPDLPRISLSTRYRNRDNNIERFNPFLPSQNRDLQNAALRNYEVSDGDTLVTAMPQKRGTLSVNSSISQDVELFSYTHQLSVNYGITNTKDHLFAFGNSKSQNLSFRITSRIDRIELPIRTRIGYNINRSESMGGLSDVRISGVDIGAEALLLGNRLTLNTDMIYTRNRFQSLELQVNDNNNPGSFSDNYYVAANESERTRRYTNSLIVRMGAQYDLTENHAFLATVNYTANRDTYGNLGTLPNDRILQLRYIFRF